MGQARHHSKYLRNADGNPDLNTDTPALFFIQPVRLLSIRNVIFTFVDSNIRSNSFLGQPALENGLQIGFWNLAGSLVYDLCDGLPIKTTSDLGIFGDSDTLLAATSPPKDGGFSLNWNVGASKPMEVHKHQIVGVRVRDNLSGITTFRVMLHGYYPEKD